ncbi:hypothetical protein E2C01_060963 [Portunus trituberculatus]|uniref:Uncharacterized protein n=1 Tax=Portunus trituberculatus TaxID=210409 RepID=A0A5B7H400_PORTR|nr:hypothetical protein [Portunus trituberculatus]
MAHWWASCLSSPGGWCCYTLAHLGTHGDDTRRKPGWPTHAVAVLGRRSLPNDSLV